MLGWHMDIYSEQLLLLLVYPFPVLLQHEHQRL